MSVLSRPNTPCRGLCSHNVGDYICRGCGRTVEEVRDWNSYTPEQRKAAALAAFVFGGALLGLYRQRGFVGFATCVE